MPRFDSRYAPINRTERDKRENLIKKTDGTAGLDRMYKNFKTGIKIVEEAMAAGKTDDSPVSEGREQTVADLRKKLGQDAWSLKRNGYNINEATLEKLQIELSMGKVLSNGRK
jgi:hypothetical protein